MNLELEIERTLAWLRGREAKKGENRYRTYMEVYFLDEMLQRGLTIKKLKMHESEISLHLKNF